MGSASLSLVDHDYILGVCGEPFPYVVSGVCHHCALNAHSTCDVAGLALFTKGVGDGLLRLESDIWLLWYNFYFLYLHCLFSLA